MRLDGGDITLDAGGTIDTSEFRMVQLLRDWERWAAELMESHLSYPILAFYRSQHEQQSWLAGLTTILDVAALILMGIDGAPTRPARLAFGATAQRLLQSGDPQHDERGCVGRPVPARAPQITLLAGLAVAEAVSKL